MKFCSFPELSGGYIGYISARKYSMNQHTEVKMALTVEHDLRENIVTGASQAEVSLTHKPPA